MLREIQRGSWGAIRNWDRYTTRVWESEKEKWDIFSLLKQNIRKINWRSSLGDLSAATTECWSVQRKILLVGFVVRLYFTPWDLFVVYPIYYEVKFSINLRIVISIFIVEIFWSCLVVFPTTLEGFSCKIWYSYVVVFQLMLAEFFISILYYYCLVVIYFNSHIDIEGTYDFSPTISPWRNFKFWVHKVF